MRLIDADAMKSKLVGSRFHYIRNFLNKQPTIEAEPVRRGRWILEAHKEKTNYRWNVTAECSECCDEKNEIYAGFFPGVPDWLARDVVLDSAKSVKLSNYCPNCGAKMRGGNDE
jgi:hypothetical protein